MAAAQAQAFCGQEGVLGVAAPRSLGSPSTLLTSTQAAEPRPSGQGVATQFSPGGSWRGFHGGRGCPGSAPGLQLRKRPSSEPSRQGCCRGRGWGRGPQAGEGGPCAQGLEGTLHRPLWAMVQHPSPAAQPTHRKQPAHESQVPATCTETGGGSAGGGSWRPEGRGPRPSSPVPWCQPRCPRPFQAPQLPNETQDGR